MIKKGISPKKWSENNRKQKDRDTYWAKKIGKSYFGYKKHVSVDATKHKFIRDQEVTDA